MPTVVTLHIYDVTQEEVISNVNKYLQPIGTGAFHGGVEVYGLEWSYGYVENGTGVFPCTPMQCTMHRYRESLVMGTTHMSEARVQQTIEVLKREWQGTNYDLLRHNCCTFSDELCCRLGVGHIPDWVTNLAAAGATIQDGYLGAVTAAKAAAIIAAAKAGEIDAKYNIRGVAKAKARDFVEAVNHVNKTYRIKETATDVAAHAAVGAVRAAHQILVSATANERDSDLTPRARARRTVAMLGEDPFLNRNDTNTFDAPEWKGGAASAVSEVNRLIGRWISSMCLDKGRHCN
mmetsp:Transcript_168356/g.540891  ORF Transcript_168356/g.540891 Transcript_168356/m.540891 type:complete len:291 (+) Transcript_168356:175-1047(+)